MTPLLRVAPMFLKIRINAQTSNDASNSFHVHAAGESITASIPSSEIKT